jgi:hypothetical protein
MSKELVSLKVRIRMPDGESPNRHIPLSDRDEDV